MAAARVDLNGALIRPVDDPYYNQQGWGSPQEQPWWTGYNLGNTTPIATSNTPQISGGSLIGNALQQGWNAMVSPRKGVSEATAEVTAPTDPDLMQNPFEPKTSNPAEIKPVPAVQSAVAAKLPVTMATAAPPPAPPVVTQPTTASGVAQPMVIPTLTRVQQPTLVPGMVPTIQPTTTVPTVGMLNTGQQMLGGMPNGLSTVATNPATAQGPTFLKAIMAQLEELKASNKALTEKLNTISANKETTGATLSCGCPAPSGTGSGDCKCTTKTDASKKMEDKKPSNKTTPVKKSEKVNKTKKKK
jgi:hypothetical protein